MKKLNFNKRRCLLRPVVLPFVFGILLVSHLVALFKSIWLFLLYGGEWVNFTENEVVTQTMIYDELKKQNALKEKQIKLWEE